MTDVREAMLITQPKSGNPYHDERGRFTGPMKAGDEPPRHAKGKHGAALVAKMRVRNEPDDYFWLGEETNTDKAYLRSVGNGPANSGTFIPQPHTTGLRATAVYRGEDGKPVGYAVFTGSVLQDSYEVASVFVRPSERGKGYGFAMYDWLQDQTPVDMYEAIGRTGTFTKQGKAFALAWLDHRLEIEAKRAGIREARIVDGSPLDHVLAAIVRVRAVPEAEDGERSPEEDVPVREAVMVTDPVSGNPYHDTSDGRFTGKGGASGAAAAAERVRRQSDRVNWANDASDWEQVIGDYSDAQLSGPPNTGDMLEPGPYSEWNDTFIYRGRDGKPAGWVLFAADAEGEPIIEAVMVRPGLRGQGIGTAMYDYVQDHTYVNLYDVIGASNSFTKQGKAFALDWLTHRLDVEAKAPPEGQMSLGLKEAAAESAVERVKRAIERVKRAKVDPKGMPSPEEGPEKVREAGNPYHDRAGRFTDAAGAVFADAIPSSDQEIVRQFGVTVVDDPKTTYYDPATKTIHVEPSLRGTDAELHEFGHALDHALGWPSQTDAYKAVAKPFGGVSAGERAETFATAYSVWLNPQARPMGWGRMGSSDEDVARLLTIASSARMHTSSLGLRVSGPYALHEAAVNTASGNPYHDQRGRFTTRENNGGPAMDLSPEERLERVRVHGSVSTFPDRYLYRGATERLMQYESDQAEDPIWEERAYGDDMEGALEGMRAAWINSAYNPESALIQASVAAAGLGGANPGAIWSRDDKPMQPSTWAVAAARTMYARTQAGLAGGPQSLRVFRGVATGKATRNVLESWTVDPDIADSFDGHALLEAVVPASAVFMDIRTGSDALGEGELVLLGGRIPLNTITVHPPVEKRSAPLEG